MLNVLVLLFLGWNFDFFVVDMASYTRVYISYGITGIIIMSLVSFSLEGDGEEIPARREMDTVMDLERWQAFYMLSSASPLSVKISFQCI